MRQRKWPEDGSCEPPDEASYDRYEMRGDEPADVGDPFELALALFRCATRLERGLTSGVERRKVSPVAVRTMISLRLADGGPLDLGDLARAVHVTKANVSGELFRLEREGLIHRSGDPDDRRRIRAAVTPLGTVRLNQMLSAGRAAIDEALAPLSREQQTRLRRLADLVDADLDGTADPGLADRRAEQVQAVYPGLDLTPIRTSMAVGRISGSVTMLLRGCLAQAGISLVVFHALVVVVTIDGGPLDLPSLVPLLGVNRGSVSWTLRKLESARLITRRPDPEDGRRIRAVATSDGAALTSRLLPEVRARSATAFAALSGDEQREFRWLLDRLAPAPRIALA